MKTVKEDHAKVIAQAELVILGSILLGFLINYFWPIKIAFPGIIRILLGIVIIAIALTLLFFSMEEYKKARTYSSPYKPAKALITSGPYKYFRNPMYLGRILQQIGMGVTFGNVWILLLTIPAGIFVWYGVIVPEEHYLERRFGKKYLMYKNSTKYGF